MKCKEIERLILQGNDKDVALLDHLNNCIECRQTAKICRKLAQAGEIRKDFDLSQGKIQETRRRVVEVLNRRSVEADSVLFSFFSWRLFPSGAIVLLLLFLGVFMFSDQQFRKTGNSIAAAVADPMTEINEKMNYIDGGIRSFRKQYLTARDVHGFDERADKIRKQIEIYSTALAKELKDSRRKGGAEAEKSWENN